ncbi:unnamed protein product [Cuscuta campestris]|uniref:Uncharacterized protein n=1 Tax=Cuscuta campestris TaxID=132261 RepID=A0A484NBZ5_9ASTE|nr:unnamed protein product [Cuscuta campestris]
MDNKEEAKNQILFALPMILTNTCFYFITLVSVMFVGHLGDLPLAAANLANSWASVSGLSFMIYSFPPASIHDHTYIQGMWRMDKDGLDILSFVIYGGTTSSMNINLGLQFKGLGMLGDVNPSRRQYALLLR